MGLAALVFGLLVGFFHFTGSADAPDRETVAEALVEEPAKPEAYEIASRAIADRADGNMSTQSPTPAHASLATAATIVELAQSVADLVADRPENAGKTLTIALAQVYEDATLGDIATLAAAATRAAPEQAPAIAGALARSLRAESQPALAAAVATIISLVPEQSRNVGLVVGAVLGDNPRALGMVAQTVAISTGEETFSSLSEASGVSIAVLMKESTRQGVGVPYDVPAYAAQLAPQPTRVAGDSPGEQLDSDL